MGSKLSEKTKENISELTEVPIKNNIIMENISVEKNTNRKITWPQNIKVDGLPIRTMEEVDRRLDKIAKNKKDDWER